MKSNSPVVMIGMDAAEAGLIEKLCREGKLPCLNSFIEKGGFNKLETNAYLFAGGVWPSFYSSKNVPWHGIYHNKLWRYENMRCEVAAVDWLTEKPFWNLLDQQGYNTCIIDVPMTLSRPELKNGIQISGWGTHDLITKGIFPSIIGTKIKKKFGSPIIPREFFGHQSIKSLLKLRDQLLKSTEQVMNISRWILENNNPDLFLVVLGATHRAGHYLWNLSQIDETKLTNYQRETLSNALVDIYQASDYAVGRILERVSAGALKIIFAVHGMEKNKGWTDRFPDILTKIRTGKEKVKEKNGLLYSVKKKIPWQLVREVTTRIPQGLNDWLVKKWSSDMFDWNNTKYFPLPSDHAGYLRINLKGREPNGIVENGMEYRELCGEIEEAFLSFYDPDSGHTIVDKVYKGNQLAESSPYLNYLPDLIIKWNNISAIDVRRIQSEKFGEILWKDKLPSGRSGNHSNTGWFVLSEPHIIKHTKKESYSILDLAPTVFNRLNAELPEDFQGKSIY